MDDLNNTIESIVSPLTACYDKIAEMGGTLPEQKNMANLAPAIRTILPPKPKSEWGILYTTTYPEGLPLSESEFKGLYGYVPTSVYTANGVTVPKTEVTGFEFGQKNTTTFSSNFLSDCPNLTYISDLPANMTDLGSNFMLKCQSFNSPITIPAGVTRLEINFLYNCSAFDSPLLIPEGVTYINSYFMRYCGAFTKSLTLPSTLATVKEYFMSGCNNFTGLLTVLNESTSYTDYGYELATQTPSAPIYANGVRVTGPGASNLYNQYSNAASGYYRKLILE